MAKIKSPIKLSRGVWILLKKELSDLFFSPLLYVLAALFSFIMGWLFFNYLMQSKTATTQTLTPAVVVPLFGNMNFIFIFLVPLLTMNTFSLEKKNGTLDLLFRSKLSDLEIILGKFISQVFVVLFLLSFSLIFMMVLSTTNFQEWSLVMTSYMGVVFSIMCYLAVGMFMSSLTDNPIISSVLTFCFLMGLMLLVLSTNAMENQFFAEMIQYLAVPFHYEGFVKGLVRSYSLVYFLSFIGFFLYLTWRSLQRRKW